MTTGLVAGSVVAGYRITGTLGRGGMGTVFDAEHTILGRRVALKTLHPELAEDLDARGRFIAESQTAAALDHPSIVPIYDAGEAGGVVYIAMRHVGGGDLAGLIGGGALDPGFAAEILEQVAAALDAAHRHGLVHRDVKPANILVETPSRVYLTDFGIAKRAGAQGTTRAGFFLGTIDYAAPEQIRGDAVGPPADVYAFGCVLFETLTGRRPFDRDTDLAVMNAQLNDEPPRASELRPGIAAGLDEVLARALSKSPAARFAGCRELVEAVRAVAGGAITVAPAVPPPRVEQLPADRTPLIGRRAELATLEGLLVEPAVRLVTLTGPGGSGKTRLGLAAARAVADRFERTEFVDLAPVAESSLVGTAIARALGVEELPELPVVDLLARELGAARTLVVLDNFEHVLGAAGLAGELIAAAPELTVLVTSQAPLRLSEEHELRVASLERADAVELFVERAATARPGFAPTDENHATIEAICERLDGLPLALELAAARVKLLSPQAILERLGRQLDLLTGGALDLPERQRTLRGAIEWSYGLLVPPERQLLARLGVFAGGCSLGDAEAVCGEVSSVLDGIASLVDKSLVRQTEGSDGEPRFGLLESIREHALGRLEEEGELERLRRRHAEHYVAAVEAAEPELTRANQAVWLERLDDELDNIRAAVSWAIAAGEADLALRLTGALVRFWSTRGLMAEGRRSLEEALALPGDVRPATLAKAQFALGYAALGEGDFVAAKQAFERSLDTADERGRGAALAQLAWLAMATGNTDARELAEHSLALATAAGDRITESGALGTLAELATLIGAYDEALELFDRGLALRRLLGDKRLIANSQLRLGEVELLRGRPDAATASLEQSLELARAVRDTWTVSAALASLGRARLLEGNPEAARGLFEDGLALARGRNDRRAAAELVQGLAAVLACEGQMGEAAQLARASNSLRSQTGAAFSPAEKLVEDRFLATLSAGADELTFDEIVLLASRSG